MNQKDIEWLAGLLEGEGSFMMSRNHSGGKIYLYPKVVVSMTDKDVIQRAASIFGTSIYEIPNKDKNRKQMWRAQANGSNAAQFMVYLLPHMGVRRSEKIKEILQEYGEIEPTETRRAKSCSKSAKERWAKYGTREGKL